MTTLIRRMRSSLALVLATTLSASAQTAPPEISSAPAPQKPVSSGTLLATVDSRAITQADLAPVADDIGPELARIPDGKAREAYLLDYRIDSVLVAQRAIKEKLGDTADFGPRLAYERNKLLAEALLRQTAQQATSEPALRRLYADLLRQGALKPVAGSGSTPAAPPSFEEVRGELEREVVVRAQRDLIVELRKTAKIEIVAPHPSEPAAPPPKAGTK